VSEDCIDDKIIEAAARALAKPRLHVSHVASDKGVDAYVAITAALAAGLREQIRAEAIRRAAEVARNWRPDLVMENVARGWATEDIATAILALLDPAPDEQPAQKGDAP